MHELRYKIAALLAQNYPVHETENGLYESLDLALERIVAASSVVDGQALIAGPTLSNVSEITLRHFNSVSLQLGVTAFDADVRGLLDSIHEQTKLVYLGSPSNPSGVIYTEREIRRVLERAKSAIIIIDETEALSQVTSSVALAQSSDRVVVLRALRDHSAGLEPVLISAFASSNTIKPLGSLSEEPLTAETQKRALAICDKTSEYKEALGIITDNKALMTVRLQSLGITVRDTLNNSIAVRVANPLDVQLSLQSAGVSSRNCIGQPQLADWLILPITGDISARVTIDSIAALPTEMYLFGENTNAQSGEGVFGGRFGSTMIIKRGPEKQPAPITRGQSIAVNSISENQSSRLSPERSEAAEETQ